MANPYAPPYAARPVGPGAAGTPPRDPLLAALTVVAAALLVVGAFLPWATVSFQGFTADKSGADGGDGWITLGAGVVGVLLGLWSLAGAPRILVRILLALAAIAAAGTGVYDLVDIKTRFTSGDVSGLDAGAGTGMYLTVAGAAVLVIAVLASLRRVPGTAAAGSGDGAALRGGPGGYGAPFGGYGGAPGGYGGAAGAAAGATPGYGGPTPGYGGATPGYGGPAAQASGFGAPTAAAAHGGGGAAPPLSPDRQWWWDGNRWNDVRTSVPPGAQRSPDGRYWWDGQEWRLAG